MTTAQNQSTGAPLPTYDLTGKRVVVVGGKTGIGLGIAQAASAAGASVTAASRRSFSVVDHFEIRAQSAPPALARTTSAEVLHAVPREALAS